MKRLGLGVKKTTYIDGLDERSRLTMLAKLRRINVAPDLASRRLSHLHEELSSGRSRMRLLALVPLAVELIGVEQVKRVVELTGQAKCARRLDLIAGKTITVHLFKISLINAFSNAEYQPPDIGGITAISVAYSIIIT